MNRLRERVKESKAGIILTLLKLILPQTHRRKNKEVSKPHRAVKSEDTSETMNRRRGHGGGAPPTDLLVCFPSRAHLTLMSKPICSPSRPTDPSRRNLSRSTNRGHSSPLFRSKTRSSDTEIAEPTSPKITCSGQIKARPKTRPGAVEGREMFHKQKREAARATNWLEALGIKKDVMQFLGAIRGIRFHMRCFGSFHGSVDCTTDEEDGDEQGVERETGSSASGTVFSKWFMLMEENQSLEFKKEADEEEQERGEEEVFEEAPIIVCSASEPPPNALLLMRSRSAPPKGWLKEIGGGGEMTAKMIKDEAREKERLVLMSYAPDFFKVSTDVVKETWVVGTMDPLVRSRSWKR